MNPVDLHVVQINGGTAQCEYPHVSSRQKCFAILLPEKENGKEIVNAVLLSLQKARERFFHDSSMRKKGWTFRKTVPYE